MPWLLGVALIHALIVVEKQEIMKLWAVALSILTFTFCIFGSFLVRSGMISSVHSFAYDPSRGIFIFLLVLIVLGIGTILILKKKHLLISHRRIHIFSRGGILLIQNILFLLLAFVILMGTILPLVYEIIFGSQISVGVGYYNKVTIPFLGLVLLTMVSTPFLPWKQGDFKMGFRFLRTPFIISLISFILLLLYFKISLNLFSLILFLGLNVLFGLIKAMGHTRFPFISFSSMGLAHGGIAIMVFGIFIDSFAQKEIITSLKEGESISFLNYTLKLSQVMYSQDKIYLLERANLDISKNGKKITTMHPEKRIYLSDNTLTNETALFHDYFSDVYVVLGPQSSNEKWSLKLTYHPQVLWIWIGGLFVFLGGLSGFTRNRNQRVSEKSLISTHPLFVTECG